MQRGAGTVLLRYAAPYDRQPWWLLAAEGIAAILAGVITATVASVDGVGRFVVAFAMLLAGVGQIAAGARLPHHAGSSLRMLRGGIIASVAALAVLSPWVAAIPPAGAWWLLALALIASGMVEVAMLRFTSHTSGAKAGACAVFWFAVLPIVVGALLLTAIPPEVLGALWDQGTWMAVWVLSGLVTLVAAVIHWRKTRSPV
jgi:hypothetical protein